MINTTGVSPVHIIVNVYHHKKNAQRLGGHALEYGNRFGERDAGSVAGKEVAHIWPRPVGKFGAGMGDDRLEAGRMGSVEFDVEAVLR